MMVTALEKFGEMILRGREIAAQNKRRNDYQLIVDENAKLFSAADDDAVKHLWDIADCNNCTPETCCENIHMELNRRGHGAYCAV